MECYRCMEHNEGGYFNRDCIDYGTHHGDTETCNHGEVCQKIENGNFSTKISDNSKGYKWSPFIRLLNINFIINIVMGDKKTFKASCVRANATVKMTCTTEHVFSNGEVKSITCHCKNKDKCNTASKAQLSLLVTICLTFLATLF